MKHKAHREVTIEQVEVKQENVAAKVHLIHSGVFLVSVFNRNKELLFKRFIQLERGTQEISVPVGHLTQGNYLFSLLKGGDQCTLSFHC